MTPLEPAGNGIARWSTGIAICCAAAVLLYNFGLYLLVAADAVRFPFELDYGEGIVWQQMRLIMAGKGYGPIDGWPAIVFHYPPLYHVLVATLAGAGGLDELASGRLVSIGATVMAAAMIAALVVSLTPAQAGRTARWSGGIMAALLIFAIEPVRIWSILMRVDMVFIALSLAGLWFGLKAIRRPGAIHIAALLFVAAMYAKQSALAAPVVVFGTLLVLRPRTALMGIATGLVAGLAVLAVLMEQTGGGFLRHIVSYNINRIYWYQLLVILPYFFCRHIAYILVALLAVSRELYRRWPGYRGLGPRALRRELLANPADARFVMVLFYFLVATLMLAMAAKSGASSNYLIEWSCLVALFAGVALVDVAAAAMGKITGAPAAVLAVLVPAAIAAQCFTQIDWADRVFAARAARADEAGKLVSLIRAAPKPVISDDMVAILHAGKQVQWEPAIFAELASKGVWDERPLLARIRARQFAFFITDGKPGEMVYERRYTPAVSQALREAYPVERDLAGYHLHFPVATNR